MDFSEWSKRIAAHVTAYFNERQKPEMMYHNLDHTHQVLEAARLMADHYQLSEEDRFIITAAVWFHDIAQLNGTHTGHEQKSAEMAEGYLQTLPVPAVIIEKVKGCILATMMPQQPHNLLECIVADADLYHLSTDEFKWKHKLVRSEMEQLGHIHFTDEEWRKQNIGLLEQHRYHTDYAQLLLEPRKKENLERLKRKAAKESEKAAEKAKDKEKKEEKQAQKQLEQNIPTRGIETMFRVTLSNHTDLSSMADSKANIMISVNSIIITVVLSVLMRKLEEYPNLVLPTILLLTVNVTTIVFAILAVRPKVISGTFTEEDIRQKRANLLFFGNFHRMPVSTFEWGMKEMMKDKDYLYGSMIRDLYYLGVVLGRKYRMLRIAYNIFMFGLILSVIAFAAAVMAQPSMY